jgi:hypothetical protein
MEALEKLHDPVSVPSENVFLCTLGIAAGLGHLMYRKIH